MENNDFPAKLVLSAIREDEMKKGQHRIVCFADSETLESEDDLDRRHGFYKGLEARGGWPYTYTLVHVDDLDEAMADIKATLTLQAEMAGQEPEAIQTAHTGLAELDAAIAQEQAELDGTPAPEPEPRNEAGDAATPPAREDPPAKEEPEQDDTTDADSGQTGPGPERGQPPVIAMVVRYQGTGASIIPTGNRDGATCELVEWLDGRDDIAPDGNVKRLRDWLKERGYAPEFPAWQWLDKGHGPRRRREIYRLNGTIHSLYDTTIDANFLQRMHGQMKPPQLPEAERAALYKSKALAGEGVFAPCRDCPQVQHCPYGWGACQRKAEYARANRSRRHQREPAQPGPWSASPG